MPAAQPANFPPVRHGRAPYRVQLRIEYVLYFGDFARFPRRPDFRRPWRPLEASDQGAGSTAPACNSRTMAAAQARPRSGCGGMTLGEKPLTRLDKAIPGMPPPETGPPTGGLGPRSSAPC